MAQTQKLSELVKEIDLTIRNRFTGKTFWIKSEITDVKKYPDKQYCYLKFIEKEGDIITTEIMGHLWPMNYYNIESFERETLQTFTGGIEIICNVRVKFHNRYGIAFEVLEIDYLYAIGKLEIERKHTLERLVRENASIKLLENSTYITKNNQLNLPIVIQTIALITAPNSDGQRDFNKVIKKNEYGFAFTIHSFLTTIQGDNASKLILKQLKLIEDSKEKFDVVVIVRGGGSDIDFKCFNDYDLAKAIAMFPIPILTGIGHDRNTCIVDLMSRQQRTPTDVANYIINTNYNFDDAVEELKKSFFDKVEEILHNIYVNLANYKQRVKNLNPNTILNKGFAIVMKDNKIITDPKNIKEKSELQTILKNEIIQSTVIKKIKNEKQFDI